MPRTISTGSPRKDAVRRNANNHFQAWEDRTALVKKQVESESAANDAKTIRLKALRLAKEEEDRLAALAAPPPPAPKKRRTTSA